MGQVTHILCLAVILSFLVISYAEEPDQFNEGSANGIDGHGEHVQQSTERVPIHGQWSDMEPWSTCSKTCGSTAGIMTRSRTCTNPTPKFLGKYCEGDSLEKMSCLPERHCPVDGQWSDNQPWSACSKTCGSPAGTKRRIRTCTNPARQFGGKYCVGPKREVTECFHMAQCKDDDDKDDEEEDGKPRCDSDDSDDSDCSDSEDSGKDSDTDDDDWSD